MKQMLKGHLNYFAVSGNHPSLWWLFNKVKRLLLASLKRRSQRARLSWERFIPLVARFFPPIRTLHSLPCHRFDASNRLAGLECAPLRVDPSSSQVYHEQVEAAQVEVAWKIVRTDSASGSLTVTHTSTLDVCVRCFGLFGVLSVSVRSAVQTTPSLRTSECCEVADFHRLS
jgi:hypothetical protein